MEVFIKKRVFRLIIFILLLIKFSGRYVFARYYDPEVGRFISPDTIVPSELDPQSLNRYAYVRNSPVNYTDPSGHSWLSKNIRKADNWISQHKEFSGLSFQTLDVFSGSAYLASFSNGRAILAGQIVAAGAFAIGGTSAGWGAVSGELSSAYGARKTGDNMMMSIIKGGLEGAATSATFSRISGTKMHWTYRALGKSAISAGLTELHGGGPRNVWMSAGLSFAAEAANSYFTSKVGYSADPTPGTPLGNDGGGNFTYDSKISPFPPSGKDVFGENTVAFGPLHQGAPAMRAASMIPGMQAVSQLHDAYLNTNASYLLTGSQWINIGTMIPALPISYAAQFAGPWAPFLIDYDH